MPPADNGAVIRSCLRVLALGSAALPLLVGACSSDRGQVPRAGTTEAPLVSETTTTQRPTAFDIGSLLGPGRGDHTMRWNRNLERLLPVVGQGDARYTATMAYAVARSDNLVGAGRLLLIHGIYASSEIGSGSPREVWLVTNGRLIVKGFQLTLGVAPEANPPRFIGVALLDARSGQIISVESTRPT